MGKAIIYVAVTGVTALMSFLWFALNRGNEFLFPCFAGVLAIGIASPILIRKDFQFVGIPGVFEIFIALAALSAVIAAGIRPGDKSYWLAAMLPLFSSIRPSLVSMKAYQRPKSLKLSVGAGLLALVGLNIALGYQHSTWLGETSVALVKEWFPEATAPKDRTVKEEPRNPAPKKDPPPPPVADPKTPVAIVAGRPLTKKMVEYQRYIDGLIDPTMERNDAIAALLQAFATRAVLEKLGEFKPSMLKDENQWVMNRTRDMNLVNKIRQHRSEELFLTIYVGANGLYKRALQDVFNKLAKDEFKLRAAEVLKEVQAADGVERLGPKVDGTKKEECRYSFGKSEFIGKFDTEEAEQIKANPKDPLAAKLAKLKVNHALPEIQWGDMNALIIRRVQDDFKQRPVYETYRVVKDGVYTTWFKKQCRGMVIEIPDPELRLAMINLAKDVEPIIKR